jgi:tetratricopeptide (TPR) repeat protein
MGSARWTSVAVFALALLVRLLHVQQVVANDPFYTQPSVDSAVYRDWALRIAAGDWLGTEPFFLSPLYAYVLAGVYALFGPGHLAPLLSNAFLGAGMVLLVFHLALRLFDGRAALVAGALAATYRMELFYEGAALLETLQTFLVAALALAAVAALDRPTLARFFGLGMWIGLAGLGRENALLFAPLFALASRRVSHGLAVLAGAALIVLPATLRNYAVSGDLVLVNSTGGILMYAGWNPEATGAYTVPSVLPRALADDPVEQKAAYRALAEERSGRALAPSEVSTYWRGEALRFAFAEPLDALRLGLWKARLFWSAFEAWDNRSFTVSRSTSWLLELSPVSFALVAPLALFGISASTERWRRLLPLYAVILVHFATAVLFIALSRYRVPALPAFAVFAGAGAVRFFDLTRARDVPGLARSGLVLAAAALAIGFRTPPENLAMAHFNLGNAWDGLGRHAEAEAAYLRSLALDPDYVSAWNNLALDFEKTGAPRAEVERAWRRVLELGRAQSSARHVLRAERHLRALGVPE